MKPRYTFTITGRVVPAVRMTRRGKFRSPRAQAYLASKDAIAWQLRQQMSAAGLPMLPARTPLAVEIYVTMPAGLHKCDADNIWKAAQDAGNGIVYPDDRWIDACRFVRAAGEEYKTIFVIKVI